MIDNWDLETTAYENMLIVYYADITIKFCALLAIRSRDFEVIVWSPAGEIKRETVELFPAAAACPRMIHEPGPGSELE